MKVTVIVVHAVGIPGTKFRQHIKEILFIKNMPLPKNTKAIFRYYRAEVPSIPWPWTGTTPRLIRNQAAQVVGE